MSMILADRLSHILRHRHAATPIPDVLHECFADASLSVVDIGARGAHWELLPALQQIAPNVSYFACDADRNEAVRASDSLSQQGWYSVTTIPVAIANGEPANRTLYVTKQPGLSSLLRPDVQSLAHFPSKHDFDVVREVQVKTTPLDNAAQTYGFQRANFLKLDTQGTELDIIRSGPSLMLHLVGVFVELLLQPLYVGQSGFSETDAELRRLGFRLFGMNRSLHRRAGYTPDLYSRLSPWWVHALYLLEPEKLPPSRYDTLLAYAMAFEHFDVAMEWATSMGGEIRKATESYIRCWTQNIRRNGRQVRAIYQDRKHQV